MCIAEYPGCYWVHESRIYGVCANCNRSSTNSYGCYEYPDTDIEKNIVKINYKNIVRFFEESNDIFLYYQMRLHNRNEPIQEIMMQVS